MKRLVFGLVGLFLNTGAWADDLQGDWSLTISNLKGEVVTTAKVRFLPDPAVSCMAGHWKRVSTSSAETSDKKFFPVEQPLSYRVEGPSVTIGRNEICDAYLHLTGSLDTSPIAGSYRDFGLDGGRTLGTFKLSRRE